MRQSEIIELNLFAQFGLPKERERERERTRFHSNLTNLHDISQLYIIPYQYQSQQGGKQGKMMYVTW
jgi:hypothetical protein